MNLKIDNKNIEFFNAFTLNLKFDSVASGFTFDFYFKPDNAEHKTLFKPGTFKRCVVEHEGELLITGTLLSDGMQQSNAKELSGAGGYSLPGVLEDCTIPTSLYPLQSDGLSLRQIAQKLIKPFGLTMVVDSSVSSLMDGTFKTTTADEKQTIKSYLTELAAQKNINITHNAKGQLVFTRVRTKQAPVLDFDFSANGPFGSAQGPRATKIARTFNGQAMHSEITVQKQADSDGGNAGESIISNPYCKGVFRPIVRTQSSGNDISTADAARNALADELKNLKFTIDIPHWKPEDKIILPNNIITVIAPEVYLYKKTRLFIESIAYTGNEKIDTAVLTCVVPEVYNNETPKNIFN